MSKDDLIFGLNREQREEFARNTQSIIKNVRDLLDIFDTRNFASIGLLIMTCLNFGYTELATLLSKSTFDVNDKDNDYSDFILSLTKEKVLNPLEFVIWENILREMEEYRAKLQKEEKGGENE